MLLSRVESLMADTLSHSSRAIEFLREKQPASLVHCFNTKRFVRSVLELFALVKMYEKCATKTALSASEERFLAISSEFSLRREYGHSDSHYHLASVSYSDEIKLNFVYAPVHICFVF